MRILGILQLKWEDNMEEIKAITEKINKLEEQEELFWQQ